MSVESRRRCEEQCEKCLEFEEMEGWRKKDRQGEENRKRWEEDSSSWFSQEDE